MRCVRGQLTARAKPGAGNTAKHCRGFTLIELMITLAVAAVLLIIAVPSFQHIMASTRLTTASNHLISAFRAARLEAIKRNADTQVCGTTNNSGDTLGTACGTTQPGAVYTLAGAAAAATVVQAAPAMATSSLQYNSFTAIRFDPQGIGHQPGLTAPYSNTVVVLCSSAISSDNIRNITMTTGTTLATATSTGACP